MILEQIIPYFQGTDDSNFIQGFPDSTKIGGTTPKFTLHDQYNLLTKLGLANIRKRYYRLM